MTTAKQIAEEARDFILRRYNADHDLIGGNAPLVTFTDMHTLQLIASLADRVAELEEEMKNA